MVLWCYMVNDNTSSYGRENYYKNISPKLPKPSVAYPGKGGPGVASRRLYYDPIKSPKNINLLINVLYVSL
jgi:hypothetical protein